jgi:antitoxin component of MazEF toxin-antitoxin module
MRVVKIRRVGNSNVLSIPREFERLGYRAGVAVLVDEGPAGDLRIVTDAEVSTLLTGVQDDEAKEGPADHGDG